VPAFATVQGFVVDAVTNSAISGASVNLPTAGMSTSTNGSGSFTFLNVPTGPHTLQTSASGYTSDTRGIYVTGSGAPLVVRLCPVGSPICGTPGIAVVAKVGRIF
jgi:hypothetical protein